MPERRAPTPCRVADRRRSPGAAPARGCAGRRRPPSGRSPAARAPGTRAGGPGAASRPPVASAARIIDRRAGRLAGGTAASSSAIAAAPGRSDSTSSIAAASRSSPSSCASSTASIVTRSISSSVTGSTPAGDDPGDRVAGAVERREEREQRRPRRRRGPEPERRLGDDPERPLRPDEQGDERVAGDVLDVPAAGPDHRAVGEDDLQPEHGVARLAVLHAAQPAGVRPEVAADRAHLVARRDPGRRTGPRRRRAFLSSALMIPGWVTTTRFSRSISRTLSIRVKRDRQRRPRCRRRRRDSPRPGAARHDRDPMLGGQPDERRHLGGRRRQRDGERQAGLEVRRLVVAVALAVDHVRRAAGGPAARPRTASRNRPRVAAEAPAGACERSWAESSDHRVVERFAAHRRRIDRCSGIAASPTRSSPGR